MWEHIWKLKLSIICDSVVRAGVFLTSPLCHKIINLSLTFILQVALKVINLNEIEDQYTRRNTLRESAILKSLRHPNIVRLYETVAHNDTYCFVTEYLEGGDLFSHMKRQKQYKFSEKQTRSYFSQLLYAVQYLHSKGIIHRYKKFIFFKHFFNFK